VATLLENGESVRILSNKYSTQNPRELIQYRPATHDLAAFGRPPARPSLSTFTVHVEGEYVLFESHEVRGGFLQSSADFKVTIAQLPGGDNAAARWQIFSKLELEEVPATTLSSVWLRNALSKGCLSVRSNEGWTGDGELWTRDDHGVPARPFNYEHFEVSRAHSTKSALTLFRLCR
jgi:hypothetical protein